MTALVTQDITNTGVAITFAAASVLDTAEIGDGHNTFLVFKNTNASARNMNIVAPGNTSYGQPMPDTQVNVPATNGERWVALRKEYDDGTGRATITVADATGVSVAVVRMS